MSRQKGSAQETCFCLIGQLTHPKHNGHETKRYMLVSFSLPVVGPQEEAGLLLQIMVTFINVCILVYNVAVDVPCFLATPGALWRQEKLDEEGKDLQARQLIGTLHDSGYPMASPSYNLTYTYKCCKVPFSAASPMERFL